MYIYIAETNIFFVTMAILNGTIKGSNISSCVGSDVVGDCACVQFHKIFATQFALIVSFIRIKKKNLLALATAEPTNFLLVINW